MSRLILVATIVLAAAGCSKSPVSPAPDVPASVDAEDTLDIPADVTPAAPAEEVTQAVG